MKAIIHIGTEKTGSTSLQTFLSQNDVSLRKQGIWYSRALGRNWNRKLSVYALDGHEGDDGMDLYGIGNAEDHEAFRRQIELDLGKELAEARQHDCHTFVVSSEHCHSRLTTPEKVARVKKLLGEFDDIQILCFLRPQVELRQSYISTAIRNGLKLSYLEALDLSELYYDYEALLNRWSDVFGEASIVPLPYNRNRDVLKCFCEIVGYRGEASLDTRANAALDIRAMAIANAVNMPTVNMRGGNLGQLFLNEMPYEQGLEFSSAEIEEIESKFAAANERLCQKWSTISPADLRVGHEGEEREGYAELLDAFAGFEPYLSFMVEKLSVSLWIERSRKYLAMVDLALAVEDYEGARKNLDEAEHWGKLARKCDLMKGQSERLSGRIERLKVLLDNQK